MQPVRVRGPLHRQGWVYEGKVDGWRIFAYKDHDRVRLLQLNGVDHTRRFRDLAARERDARPRAGQRLVRALAGGEHDPRVPASSSRAACWERVSRIRYTTASSRLSVHTHHRGAPARSISRHHVSSAPTTDAWRT
jgi:hypothetical protein